MTAGRIYYMSFFLRSLGNRPTLWQKPLSTSICILSSTGLWSLGLLASGFGQNLYNLPEEATLRVATRLVQVSVVAETQQGEPVADLAREDFKLSDGGHEESISVFGTVTVQDPVDAHKELPPNTFTNQIERSGSVPLNPTVILLDGLNTRIQDQVFARAQIKKFLSQLKPEDRVGLYVMGRGPRVLQEITNDSSALLKALADHRGEPNRSLEVPLYDLDMSVQAQFDAWLGELTFGLVEYFDRDRALRTVRLLESIANHLQRVPGRKNLIWVSGSFPDWIQSNSVVLERKPGSAREDIRPEIERATRALNSANLAIYPVDARGLIAPQDYSAYRATVRLQSGWPDSGTFRAMEAFADRTGGRAFRNTNDLRAALRRATDDGKGSYLLGYYPSHRSWNGKFREIKVKVIRPNVQLRYRHGYFAHPEVPSDPEYRQAGLEAAMWNPIDANHVGLTVHVSASGRVFDFDLQVDPRDIAFQNSGNNWECELDLWLVEFGSKDAYLKTTGRTANLRWDQAEYRKAFQTGALHVTQPVHLLPETMLVRVLVRDIRSGALGSVSIPVKQMVAR
jgi:VWFA-related protein